MVKERPKEITRKVKGHKHTLMFVGSAKDKATKDKRVKGMKNGDYKNGIVRAEKVQSRSGPGVSYRIYGKKRA